jgi:urease accessory protein UreE
MQIFEARNAKELGTGGRSVQIAPEYGKKTIQRHQTERHERYLLLLTQPHQLHHEDVLVALQAIDLVWNASEMANLSSTEPKLAFVV